MMHKILPLIGLCLRAGKLISGDDMVAASVDAGEARLLLLASDAGAGIRRKIAFLAEKKGIPVIELTGCTAQEIGFALGRRATAVCCITDIGFAASAAQRAAEAEEKYAQTAALLSDKNKRIQSRRGMKKTRKAPSGGKKSGGSSKSNYTKRGGERA